MITTFNKNSLRFWLISLVVLLVLVGIPFLADAQTETGGADPAGTGSVDDSSTNNPANTEDAVLIPSSLEGLVYNMSVGIGGFFLWIGGGLLDYSVTKLVVGMGDYLNGNVGVAVDKMWVLVRDLFNVLFIFGLIWIGFRVILFSEDSQVKKTLGLLIIAALMINFSLFITKAIVDFSNITAIQVYNALAQEQKLVSVGGSTVTIYQVDTKDKNNVKGKSFVNNPSDFGVTNAFMNLFNITTYANGKAIAEYKDSTQLGGRLMFFGLMMMFVMLIAAFVFAAGAFLLIARFVGLILFMILSPAMFLGLIFPLFKSYQDMWWKMFLKYAFVGPAYLFLLYLSIFILQGLSDSGSFSQAFKGDSFSSGAFIIFLNFFIIAGFLIASLVIANKMGIYGAETSMGMLKGAGNYVRGGVQGFAGRNTIGRFSGAAKWANDSLEQTKGGRFTKGLLTAATLGMVDERTRRGLVDKGLGAKFGGSRSRMDDKEWASSDGGRARVQRELQRDANKKESEAENKKEYAKQTAAINDDTKTDVELAEAIDNLGKNVKAMSDDERAALGEDLKNETVAFHLSDDHISALEKSGRFSNQQINDIKTARKNAFSNVAAFGTMHRKGNGITTNAAGNPIAPATAHPSSATASFIKGRRQALVNRGNRDVGKMDHAIFKDHNMYDYLTPSMVEERIRNGASTDDRNQMRSALYDHLGIPPRDDITTYAAANPNSAWSKWHNGNSTQAAFFFDHT